MSTSCTGLMRKFVECVRYTDCYRVGRGRWPAGRAAAAPPHAAQSARPRPAPRRRRGGARPPPRRRRRPPPPPARQQHPAPGHPSTPRSWTRRGSQSVPSSGLRSVRRCATPCSRADEGRWTRARGYRGTRGTSRTPTRGCRGLGVVTGEAACMLLLHGGVGALVRLVPSAAGPAMRPLTWLGAATCTPPQDNEGAHRVRPALQVINWPCVNSASPAAACGRLSCPPRQQPPRAQHRPCQPRHWMGYHPSPPADDISLSEPRRRWASLRQVAAASCS